MDAETIFAPATGKGPGGIAVVRISGPRAGDALMRLTGEGRLPAARRATKKIVRDGAEGDEIDEGLILWFPGPGSFTGEDVGEVHIHGGTAVMAGVLGVLGKMDGLRWAEAGEFTRRAVMNGKMDLTAAEGLADLVAAETEAQRKQALQQLRGELGNLYEGWREKLLRAQVAFEASIDFSDEDIPEGLIEPALRMVKEVSEEIRRHLEDGRRGERLREGVEVAIVGAPNVGKSSLLNWLGRREAAIVSEWAGTTRDVIEIHLDLGGFPVVLADTAGLRSTEDGVEREGVRRAEERAGLSDLKIAVFDGSRQPVIDRATAEMVDGNTVVLVNKIDLVGMERGFEVKGVGGLGISLRSGEGLEEMITAVTMKVGEMVGMREGVTLTRTRHRLGLEDCMVGLDQVGEGGEVELRAEDLRRAIRALGKITGKVGVEEVLEAIFRDFCVGK